MILNRELASNEILRFRQIEGFGVHTFRLVNREGQSYFVKFHWKPVHGF
jgi:catalase